MPAYARGWRDETSTGAEARLLLLALYAALKRRSSTSQHEFGDGSFRLSRSRDRVILRCGRVAGATVEERPFEGRVGLRKKSRALAPVVVLRRLIPDLEATSSECDRCHTRFYSHASTIRSMDSQRTFFITTVTWQRLPSFSVDSRARLLIEVLFGYRDQARFLLHEFVVMPDHVHLLLTPAPEISVERAVQFIKGGYSYRLRKLEKIKVWQESFTNHRIRDAEDYERHCEYIRLNPVRARLVREAGAYAFSSASSEFRVDDVPQGLKPGFPKSA